jgi:hypothetical protein
MDWRNKILFRLKFLRSESILKQTNISLATLIFFWNLRLIFYFDEKEKKNLTSITSMYKTKQSSVLDITRNGL